MPRKNSTTIMKNKCAPLSAGDLFRQPGDEPLGAHGRVGRGIRMRREDDPGDQRRQAEGPDRQQILIEFEVRKLAGSRPLAISAPSTPTRGGLCDRGKPAEDRAQHHHDDHDRKQDNGLSAHRSLLAPVTTLRSSGGRAGPNSGCNRQRMPM